MDKRCFLCPFLSVNVSSHLLIYQVVDECRFYHEPGTEAVTSGIKVSVATAFIPAASTISPPHFRHSYRITYVIYYCFMPHLVYSHLVVYDFVHQPAIAVFDRQFNTRCDMIRCDIYSVLRMMMSMLLVECRWMRPRHPKTHASCRHGVGPSQTRKVERRKWKDREL